MHLYFYILFWTHPMVTIHVSYVSFRMIGDRGQGDITVMEADVTDPAALVGKRGDVL